MSIFPGSIDHIAMDMRKTIEFYRLLGLNLAENAEDESYVEFVTENGYHLTWLSEEMAIEGFGDKYKDLPGRGRVKLAFECTTTDEVDTTYHRMTAAGYVGETPPADTD